MRTEDTNTRAWQIYGRGQLDRACSPPLPDPLGGTPWDGIGPGAEVLGDVTGRRVRLLPLPGVSACPSAPPSWLAAQHGYVFDGCLVLGCRRTGAPRAITAQPNGG
ncbi:hypothetical protein [Streptomyces sp. NPDC007117]|uniref:hypothetical protein n=1 Tax=Streptomyces sp. NPDC007117 TaxID=3154314 RepID=UPI0033D9EF32